VGFVEGFEVRRDFAASGDADEEHSEGGGGAHFDDGNWV
jgi:hypothetical protein